MSLNTEELTQEDILTQLAASHFLSLSALSIFTVNYDRMSDVCPRGLTCTDGASLAPCDVTVRSADGGQAWYGQ